MGDAGCGGGPVVIPSERSESRDLHLDSIVEKRPLALVRFLASRHSDCPSLPDIQQRLGPKRAEPRRRPFTDNR